MTEDHFRGVLKSLIEALIYLKKQGIVHRNIRPSNMLLTSDGRIVSFLPSSAVPAELVPKKLGDFDLATCLPPSKLPADCFMDSPHFVAP